MDRREFTKIMGAVVAGMAAGSKVLGAEEAKSDKHVCAGQNSCKGKGGCKDPKKPVANDCKGKGGCATSARHECAGHNACKGQGGCKTGDAGCAGKNGCEKKGGCAVPVKKPAAAAPATK